TSVNRTIDHIGISWSVRTWSPSSCPLNPFTAPKNDEKIVGNVLIKPIIPPNATAPAPIYFKYLSYISWNPISETGISAGKITVLENSPKKLINGIIPNQPITAPANIIPAIFDPTIKPTPNKAGIVFIPIAAFLHLYISHSTDDAYNLTSSVKSLNNAPLSNPPNSNLAPFAPSSPAIRTSAQAVPSG